MISVIIPTYNEASRIGGSLDRLRPMEGNFEVLVVDGLSADGTFERAQALTPGFGRPLRVLRAPRHRAAQLNTGASAARGNALLFLHADVWMSDGSFSAVEAALSDPQVIGGNFSLVFSGTLMSSRFFTWANRQRRRLGIYYGDSGVFVRRWVFGALGGFRPMPLLEDYEFVRRMERLGRTVCLKPEIVVSDRRWRIHGVRRTLFAWIAIQGLYSFGAPAEKLARWYPAIRDYGGRAASPTIERGAAAGESSASPAQALGFDSRSPVK